MADEVKAPPIKWDPADGQCPHCAAFDARKLNADGSRNCDGCGCRIPVYVAMQGAGYESHTVHHWHLQDLGARAAWAPSMLELCRECYLKDHAAFYPGRPLPKCMAVINEPPKVG